MDALYLFLALVVVNLLQPNSFALAKPQPQIAPRANAILIPHEKDVSKVTRLGWTSTITALTFFTPSPSADPIPITSQGQTVTSHVPILTICPFVSSIPSLPSLAVNTSFPATTASLATAASGYASDGSALYRRQVAAATDTPYTNASVPTSYLSSCSVSYTPTTTQICHSTLTPLASPAITITDCIQQVTFSTDHGYTIVPGNKTSSIIDLTSYYAARWDVIENGLPTGQGIRKEVCSTGTIAGCSSVWEAWLPSTVGLFSLEEAIQRVMSAGSMFLYSRIACSPKPFLSQELIAEPPQGWVPEVSTYTVGPPVSVTGVSLHVLSS